MTKYNDKAKDRTIRYMKDKRDKLTLNLPKGDKERYKAHAEKQGKSLTGLIVELIEKDMEKDR
jgi:predicted HicB family RNase H-like nuclease